jgi:oligosaccharide repeat unit polymerase
MLALIILFAIAAAALAWLVWTVWQSEHSRAINFSPFVLFCLHELVFVWPPAMYARATGMSPNLYASCVVLSATFAFVGAYVFMRHLHNWRGKPREFHARRLKDDRAGHLGAVLIIAAVLSGLGVYLFQGLPPAILGLVELAKHGISLDIADFVGEARFQLTKGHYFGEEYRGQGPIRLLMAAGWPLLTAIALVLYRTRGRRRYLVAFGCLVLMCLTFIGGDGTRGPFLWAMIAVFVTSSFVLQIRARTCIAFTAVLFAMLLGLSLTKKLAGHSEHTSFVSASGQHMVERVFLGNGLQSVDVIELVQDDAIGLRYGEILMTDLLNSLPLVEGGQPFALELYFIQNPFAKSTKTTFSSMTFLGKLFGDFGWPGCVVGYALLGGLVALVSQHLFQQPKSIVTTAITGLVCFALGQINFHGPINCAWAISVMLFVSFCYTLAVGRARHSPPATLAARLRPDPGSRSRETSGAPQNDAQPRTLTSSAT